MPLYTYKHPACGLEIETQVRNDRVYHFCARCGVDVMFHRVFGFSIKPPMQEHFNKTLGRPVSSMKQFKDGLKAASEEASMPKTVFTPDGEKVTMPAIEHNYTPLEWGDHQAFGATNEGIEESNRIRSKIGAPLLPEVK